MLGMVLADLKKVFDTVDHRVLCNKLKLRGNSPGSNATSLTEHNTVVYVAITLMWEKLKLMFQKGHALDLSYF